jgi:hypothetical protein
MVPVVLKECSASSMVEQSITGLCHITEDLTPAVPFTVVAWVQIKASVCGICHLSGLFLSVSVLPGRYHFTHAPYTLFHPLLMLCSLIISSTDKSHAVMPL